jgi:hypothetical protein
MIWDFFKRLRMLCLFAHDYRAREYTSASCWLPHIECERCGKWGKE